MTKVRVIFDATTLLHVSSKQSSFDPGSDNDQWARRIYTFGNYDPIYSIEWHDTEFSMKSGYTIVNRTTGNGIEDSRWSDQSLIRGHCGQTTMDITDLLCFVSVLEGYSPGQSPSPDNYRQSYINLSIPHLTLESIFDDSISFVVSDPDVWRSVGISYSDDERWYSTFTRKLSITAFDTVGVESKPACRLVFYAPE